MSSESATHPIPGRASEPAAARRTPGAGEAAYAQQFARRFEAARAAVQRVRHELPDVLTVAPAEEQPPAVPDSRFAVPQLSPRAPRASTQPAAAPAVPLRNAVTPNEPSHDEGIPSFEQAGAHSNGGGSHQEHEPEPQPAPSADERPSAGERQHESSDESAGGELTPHIDAMIEQVEAALVPAAPAPAMDAARAPDGAGDHTAPALGAADVFGHELASAAAAHTGPVSWPTGQPVPTDGPSAASVEPGLSHVLGGVPAPVPGPLAQPVFPTADAGPAQLEPITAPEPSETAHPHGQAGSVDMFASATPRGFDWGGDADVEDRSARAGGGTAKTASKTRLQVLLVVLAVAACLGLGWKVVAGGGEQATMEFAPPTPVKPAVKTPANGQPGGKDKKAPGAAEAAPASTGAGAAEAEAPVAPPSEDRKATPSAPAGAPTPSGGSGEANGLASAADTAATGSNAQDPFQPS